MTTPLLNEIDILRDVTGRLDRAGTAYMITGSMAMNYYAQPRMTRDIDVVVEIIPAEVDKIEAIFSSDYIIDHDALCYAAEHEFMFNIIHCQSVIKVDFIVRKSSEYRRLEFSRRIKANIADFHAWLVSKEDLVLSKLYWARESHSELQLGDVRNLLATECDFNYLSHWAEELGVNDLLKECLP
jgi:hypothetical protein